MTLLNEKRYTKYSGECYSVHFALSINYTESKNGYTSNKHKEQNVLKLFWTDNFWREVILKICLKEINCVDANLIHIAFVLDPVVALCVGSK